MSLIHSDELNLQSGTGGGGGAGNEDFSWATKCEKGCDYDFN